MDMGGGSGALIGGLLHHNPGLKGMAFDLARCEDGAREHFNRLVIADRYRFVAGDFLEAPGAAVARGYSAVGLGFDILMLKSAAIAARIRATGSNRVIRRAKPRKRPRVVAGK
jgi:hypothetical protein